MELTDPLRTLLRDAAQTLRGAARRRFMAQTRERLQLSQRAAQRQFGWARETLRKAGHELRTGVTCLDACHACGRKPIECQLPQLRAAIEAIVQEHCQTDPTFQTTRRYSRLTAAEVRRQLRAGKGYTDAQLPTIQTITTKLNAWGFHLRKVAKAAPKKVPETDAIFDQLKEVHAHAAESPQVLRVALDAKATVKIGPFSPGGANRTGTQAADHDFQPAGTLTPFGLFLPDHDELHLHFTASKITSDFIVDTLDEWWQLTRPRFPQTQVLLLNLDNGPEWSHRSQFMYRLVRFAQQHQLTVRLAYDPPYHSKYNPIERCWGRWRITGGANCWTARRPSWVTRAA